MKKISIFTIAAILLFTSSFTAIAQNKVVVVPLGGKGYEPQNPIVIPAADFRTDGTVSDSIFFSFNGYIEGTNGNNSCIAAPAYLPDGVTVTQFTAIVNDNDASVNLSFQLYRASITIPREARVTMAVVLTSGGSSIDQSITDTTIFTGLVDTKNYVYYVGGCLQSSNNRLYAVKIHYSK